MNATERSIVEQFPLWERATAPLPKLDPALPVVLVGCGTSLHIAQSVAAALTLAGVQAWSVAGGEWWLRPQAYSLPGRPVQVIVLSRSGETTEAVRAARRSRADGLPVIAITVTPDSSLARAADTVVLAETHPEEGVVMTASASLMLLLGLRLAGIDTAGAAAAAAGLLQEVDRCAGTVLEGRTQAVFLGGGPLHGIAREAALKMQEMSLTPAEAYPTLDYRHGPIALADAGTLAVMLHAADAAPDETALAGELEQRGVRVLGLGGPGTVSLAIPGPPALRPLVCLPALQILGERQAGRRGLDTTRPRGLSKVVSLPDQGRLSPKAGT
ncbi:MAG TPA: SIS domain-containing protein [Acetobacteraceae bacterium]|nr:SIS domain-containing protein [Acetobacteraceae bacterium]